MIVRARARRRAARRSGNTAPTAGSTRCGSRARCASRAISWSGCRTTCSRISSSRCARRFIGYTSGTLLGIASARCWRGFEFLGKVLDPFILALNGIPRIALAPLFIIWFGIGEPSKIVLAGLLSFFLCFYATLSGLRSVDPAYIAIARVMGANERRHSSRWCCRRPRPGSSPR